MYLDEKQLKKYTCKLEEEFLEEFTSKYKGSNWCNISKLYNSNDMLDFLLTYNNVSDKSKQYYFYMCTKTFGDIPSILIKKYNTKFAIRNCGNEIYDSYGCLNSNLLIGCNDIKDSFGCLRCKFSHHLLYCTSQRHKSYMAFNKEVTKKRFLELTLLSPEELKDTPEFVSSIYHKINTRIEFIYKLK